MLDSYFKKRGIRDRVEIEYFTRDPEPIGEHRNPAVWMDDESRRRKIKQHYEFVVRSIDPKSKVVSGLYGYKISYDLLVMVPPHRPAQALLDCGLAETENGIRVDYETMRTKWDNVYAIGDCADMPASKSGGVAHQEADVLAHNLAVEITGKGRPVDLWLHTI
jgi:sulfide:quinone oxidoreductase